MPFTPFDPGRLDDEALRQTAAVRLKLTEAAEAVKLRDSEIDRLGRLSTEAQGKLALSERSLQQRTVELDSVRQALADQVNRGRELSERLDALQQKLPRIGVQDLVGQFKSQIDRVNAEVLSQAGSGMLVDSVDVEVRGGLDVEGGLHLTQLPAAALGASSLSTLRFNLRPATSVRLVDDEAG